jgi:hypothetical protein
VDVGEPADFAESVEVVWDEEGVGCVPEVVAVESFLSVGFAEVQAHEKTAPMRKRTR